MKMIKAAARSLLVMVTVTAPAPVLAQDGTRAVDWSGFYAGIFGGYALDRSPTNATYEDLYPYTGHVGDYGSEADTRIGAPFGGATGGFAWQYGSLVLGGEVDASIGNYSKRDDFHLSYQQTHNNGQVDALDGGSASTYHIGGIGTVRARIGVTPTQGWLFYLTGGVAVADRTVTSDLDLSETSNGVTTPIRISQSSSQLVLGPTVGAGIETMLAPRLSLKGEYSYIAFSDVSADSSGGFGGFLVAPSAFGGAIHTIKLGLNYHF